MPSARLCLLVTVLARCSEPGSFRGAPGEAGEPAVCPGPPIHEVQGAGHRSRLEGHEIQGLCGIVTAVGHDAVWIEAPEADWDADVATSEAIRLATANTAEFVLGEWLEVDGLVAEEADRSEGLPVTTLLVDSPVRRRTSTGGTPAPVPLGRAGRRPPGERVASEDGGFDVARNAADFFESLEGMRVVVDAPVSVAASQRGFGYFVADAGAFASPRTARGGLANRAHDSNPERLPIRAAGLPPLDVGDRLQGAVEGVLAYEEDEYVLVAPEREERVVRAAAVRSSSAVSATDARALIATYNLENLDRAEGSRLRALAEDIARRLGKPDVIAVQEVQDDAGAAMGTLSAAKNLQALVEAIEEEDGPRYAFVDSPPHSHDADGGRPGANIRVGYLYRADRARLDAAWRLSPDDPAWTNSRKPLVARFCLLGQAVMLVNVHLVSRLGDDPMFGVWQPPRRPSLERRAAQVELVARFVRERRASGDATPVVVLGDFNDPEWSTSMAALGAVGLVDLVRTLPDETRYTYGYRGGFDALDRILVSPSLGAASVDIVHLNADFSPARRASDHDPVVALLPLLSGPSC